MKIGGCAWFKHQISRLKHDIKMVAEWRIEIMDIIVHGNLSGKKIQFNVWSCMVIFVATMIMSQWMEWISDSWNIAMFDKKLRGEDALWCSSEILTCEWSIPGYLDACSIKYLLIINWPSIEWRCHRSRFTEGDIVILLLYVSMFNVCSMW